MRRCCRCRAIRSRTVVLCLMGLLSFLGTLVVVPVQAQSDAAATPSAGDEAPGSLAAMLGRLPELPLVIPEDQEIATLSYGDYAAQLATLDVTPPTSMEDPTYERWLQATRGMPPMAESDYVFTPEWRPSFGFDAFQIDQSAQYRGDDVYLSLVRGRFDLDEVQTALQGSGYQPVTVDGETFLSAGEDGEIDFDSPAGSMTVGTMNNAVILDDGTLVFSSTRDAMRAMLAVGSGDAPSLADQDDVAPLIRAARPDLAAAWITSGLSFGVGDPLASFPPPGGTPDLNAFATAEAERSRLPQVATVLLGVTAGGPLLPLGGDGATPEPPAAGLPIASAQVGLLMAGQDAAEESVSVLEDRLATLRTRPGQMTSSALDDRPYAELFPQHEVRVAAEAPVVLIDLGLGEDTPHTALFLLWFESNLGLIEW